MALEKPSEKSLSEKSLSEKTLTDKAARRERRGKEGEQNPRISDFVLAIHRVATAMGETDVFEKNGITIAEWAMLKSIGDKKDLKLAEVSRSVKVSRQRMRTLLSELEDKGFLKSSKTDDSDGRKRTISVLPKSAQVIAALEKDFDGLGEKVLPLGMAISTNRLGSWTRMMAKLAHGFRRSENQAKAAPVKKGPKTDAERAAAKARRQAERKEKGGGGGGKAARQAAKAAKAAK